MKNTTNKTYIAISMTFMLAFAMIMAIPTGAQAYYSGHNGSYLSFPGGYYIPQTSYDYNYPSTQYVTPAPVYNTVYYPQPTYNTVYYPTAPVYNNYVYYPSLSVSCTANATFAPTGSSVTWTAYASGGNGAYTYSWTGSDGLYGYGQSLYFTYGYPGQKYASATVYSNGQSITQSCGQTVTVGSPIVYQNPYPVQYPVSSNAGLDIACYADPVTASTNQPVTWTAEVTGGIAPYSYSWTGSDGLNGSQSSVIKYYSASGEKDAIVTVTSADGRTGTRACSNSLTVHSAYRPVAKASQAAPAAAPQSSQLSAASLFSLSNIPWGWVAFLVILVLFCTVLYLMFNKPKI